MNLILEFKIKVFLEALSEFSDNAKQAAEITKESSRHLSDWFRGRADAYDQVRKTLQRYLEDQDEN